MSQNDTPFDEIAWVRPNSEQWDELRDAFRYAQDDRCAICSREFKIDPDVDHCHASGFVRGVLCTSCNTKLGWFEKHRLAIDAYLKKAGEFQAHRIKDKLSRSERLRHYWQHKEPKKHDPTA